VESKLKVTDIPDECSFYDLVAGDNVLEIPLFQRPYMWKESHFKTLVGDVETVEDDPTSAIFLGVIVSYSRGSGPGRPPTWMVVDGQQRVTTLYLCVMASVYVAASNGDLDWAADIIGRYLLVRPMSGLTHNTKLVPSFNDRKQFLNIWERINKIKNLSTHQMYAYNRPKPPAPGGDDDGPMVKQFNVIVKDLSRLYKEIGLAGLTNRIDIITTKLSVVSISLREPTVAPKIFERLNFGAEPITVADLVRNEIFARAGDDLAAAHNLFASRWEPFISKFREKGFDFNRFLFPYGLIKNPNVKRNDLFISIRSFWDQLGGPEKIIDDLEKYQAPYLALSEGVHLEAVSAQVDLRIKRLVALNRPSSIYPFLIPLLIEFAAGRISEKVTIDTFDVIESFLFRRAVLGIEPTGLHSVFKGLWQDLIAERATEYDQDSFFSSEALRSNISSRATVSWPNDDDFKAAIISGPLYRRKVANYAIREHERSLSDECPADLPQIEHIAPQKMSEYWADAIPENYEKVIHTWGNLVPISPEMNPSASAKSFADKRTSYLKSRYASVRKLGTLEVWSELEIRARSNDIASWAVLRWPY